MKISKWKCKCFSFIMEVINNHSRLWYYIQSFLPNFVVQSLSQLFATPWTTAHEASLSFTISLRLHKFMSIESVMPSNHLVLCCFPFLLLQSFPASVSFPMSQFFTSGGQSVGASTSASVLPVNIQGWFPLGLTGLRKERLEIESSNQWPMI